MRRSEFAQPCPACSRPFPLSATQCPDCGRRWAEAEADSAAWTEKDKREVAAERKPRSSQSGTRKGNPEAQILASIRLALGAIPECDFQRLSQGFEEQDTGAGTRKFRVGMTPGASDLIGCVLGRFVGLEVKTSTGRLSEDQRIWFRRMRRVGAVVECVRSAAEAVAIVEAVIQSVRSGAQYVPRTVV